MKLTLRLTNGDKFSEVELSKYKFKDLEETIKYLEKKIVGEPDDYLAGFEKTGELTYDVYSRNVAGNIEYKYITR